MKKHYLKPWIQDMLFISAFFKIGLSCLVIEQMFRSKLTMAVAIYIVLSLAAEAWIISKFDIRESMLFEGKHVHR